ncbi:hypothetical protein [Bacillus paranthracis]|uniref:hypothetical protein n=1 Tax=Bacillus paranthracis TaxID=2026186 RepID=UPI00187AD161|nr:hypothetical protein [Bacillus paranthracis]
MYTYNGMTKITYKEAVSRFNNKEEVFRLYDDNTEGLCESLEDIEEHHEQGGEFGHE